MQFRHEQLPNGLDIVAEVSEAAHSASLGFFVKTGARDEFDAISGASHFLISLYRINFQTSTWPGPSGF